MVLARAGSAAMVVVVLMGYVELSEQMVISGMASSATDEKLHAAAPS